MKSQTAAEAAAALAERAGDKVADYSGGMERRLNIAAGLLHRPRLLVLDEPTAGVDPQSRNAILSQVEAMGTEGIAVLYTTHYMEEAERLCDRVGIIDQGRLVAEGTRRELVARVGERDRIELAATGDLAGLAAPSTRELADAELAPNAVGGVEIGGELDPLRFTSGERRCETLESQVIEPDFGEHLVTIFLLPLIALLIAVFGQAFSFPTQFFRAGLDGASATFSRLTSRTRTLIHQVLDRKFLVQLARLTAHRLLPLFDFFFVISHI